MPAAAELRGRYGRNTASGVTTLPMGAKKLRQTLEREGIHSRAILEAVERVPRELFVPPDRRGEAYRNAPLPIGEGQTISQPYTVAFMLELAGVSKGMRCLEIGSGSGYAAALMAEVVGPSGSVTAIELLEGLAERGRENLRRAGYERVTIVTGDGRRGYEEGSPYDAILVSAEAEQVPEALPAQLAEGGRLVLPVRRGEGIALMKRIIRDARGYRESDHGGFSFVPLRGM